MTIRSPEIIMMMIPCRTSFTDAPEADRAGHEEIAAGRASLAPPFLKRARKVDGEWGGAPGAATVLFKKSFPQPQASRDGNRNENYGLMTNVLILR